MTSHKPVAPAQNRAVEAELCNPYGIYEGGELLIAGRIGVAEAFSVKRYEGLMSGHGEAFDVSRRRPLSSGTLSPALKPRPLHQYSDLRHHNPQSRPSVRPSRRRFAIPAGFDLEAALKKRDPLDILIDFVELMHWPPHRLSRIGQLGS
jgi:hypothetical protein